VIRKSNTISFYLPRTFLKLFQYVNQIYNESKGLKLHDKMTINDNILAIFCLIFATTSIIGNILVSHIILRYKSLKTSMNFLLLNLAFVDTITGVLGIYHIMIDDKSSFFGTNGALEKVYNKSSVAAEVLCKIKTSFWFGSAITPALLVLIAVERYMAVVHPISFRRRIRNGTKWSILFCWLFGLSFLLIKILTITYSDGQCKSTIPRWYNLKVYAVAIILLHFIFPFSFIFGTYYKVTGALTAKNTPSVQPSIARARSRDKRIVIVVVIIVSLVFLICSGVPKTVFAFQILFAVRFYNINGYIPVLLFLIYSASNPIIYFTLIGSFRRKLVFSLRFWANKSANETRIIWNNKCWKNIKNTNVTFIFIKSCKSVKTLLI